MKWMSASLGALVAALPVYGQTALKGYAVDPAMVTVSGISSGGFMAVQLDVAYASRFHGLAVFAGGPFYCAQASVSTATGACESGTGISVSTLTAYTDAQADAGNIDSPAFLAGKPVYLFSGTLDTTVHQAVMDALQDYLETYVSASEVTYDNTTAAAHGWISLDGPNACNLSYLPYINNCHEDAEQTFLGMFYGTLAAKSAEMPDAGFVQFDQNEFCAGGACSGISMDSTGWAYVPQSCAGGAPCKLVVALHGCLMYQGVIQQQFVQKSGLDEWADTNGIIVLYPQTITSSGNPEGCWDWFGYTGANYALKSAPQMQAIMGMVDRITGGSGPGTDGGHLTDGGSGAGGDGGAVSGGGDGGEPGADGGSGGTGPAKGCGCSEGGVGAAWALIALGCAVRLRRPRRPDSLEPL
jgi:poly(3-hydroxybutyrate) depolymerase